MVRTDVSVRAITEPADDNMYTPMSRAVGDFLTRGRAASAPPSRPSGVSSENLIIQRGETPELVVEHSLPYQRRRRMQSDIVGHEAATSPRRGMPSDELDREAVAGHLRHRPRKSAGEPTGTNQAIYGVDGESMPLVGQHAPIHRAEEDLAAFEGAFGKPTRSRTLQEFEAGSSPDRFSVVNPGVQIKQRPNPAANRVGVQMAGLLRRADDRDDRAAGKLQLQQQNEEALFWGAAGAASTQVHSI